MAKTEERNEKQSGKQKSVSVLNCTSFLRVGLHHFDDKVLFFFNVVKTKFIQTRIVT